MEQGKAGWSDTYRHKHMHTNMHSQWIGKRCSCVELRLFLIDWNWTVLTGTAVLSFGCPWLNSPYWCSCIELWLSLTEQSLLVQLCWALAVPDWTVLTGAAVLSFGCPWLNSPYWYSCVELWLSLTEQSLLVQLYWALAVPDWTVLTGAAVLSLGCSQSVQLCWAVGSPWLNRLYWFSGVKHIMCSLHFWD